MKLWYDLIFKLILINIVKSSVIFSKYIISVSSLSSLLVYYVIYNSLFYTFLYVNLCLTLSLCFILIFFFWTTLYFTISTAITSVLLNLFNRLISNVVTFFPRFSYDYFSNFQFPSKHINLVMFSCAYKHNYLNSISIIF